VTAVGIATAGRWRWRRSFSGFHLKISINYLVINNLTVDNPTINCFSINCFISNRLAIYHSVVNYLTINNLAKTTPIAQADQIRRATWWWHWRWRW
jgi:hypothetical protein